MNKTHWEIFDDEYARLYNKYDERMASLIKSGDDLWSVDVAPYFIQESFWIEAKDMKEAVNRATIAIRRGCDRIIRHTTEFRDGLPINEGETE